MTNFKAIFFITAFTFFICTIISAQQTYLSASNKISNLIDTKLLKTGTLVLLEEVRICGNTLVKLLHPSGEEELLPSVGNAVFHSFNELSDNNWALILITNPSDDIPLPLNIHIITFIDEVYTIYSISNDQTSIPLEEIRFSGVINGNELFLAGISNVYFSDLELSTTTEITLPLNLQFLYSSDPDDNILYFKYLEESTVKNTKNKFTSEELLASNLDSTFVNVFSLRNYYIFNFEETLVATNGVFGGEVIDQDLKINDLQRHGQNLRYYTLSSDDILTMKKLFLDENGVLQSESFQVDISSLNEIPQFHWDGNFKGYSYNFIPLPEEDFVDAYRGNNHILNYNMEDYDLNTQFLDISIDDIEYTATVDTTQIDPEIFLYYADILMEITVTNNTDQLIEDVHLHSSAFEGFNCANNVLRVDQEIISIQPNESVIITAKYNGLEYNSLSYLEYPLCVYAIGANYKADQNFDDNIYCLSLSEFTSTEEKDTEIKLEVFPNLAQDKIQLVSFRSNNVYHIYSMQGQLMAVWEMKSQADQFDISGFSKGKYYVLDEKENVRVSFTKM